MEVIFRHLGFVRLDSASLWEVFFWLTPELLVLPTAVAVYIICRFLSKKPANAEDDVSLHTRGEVSKKAEDSTAKVSLRALN